MREQDRIAFENWALSQGHKVCRHHLDHNDYAETSTFFMWNAYQQATAEANKRIAELQSEVAAFEAISFVQMKQIEELQSELRALKQEVK